MRIAVVGAGAIGCLFGSKLHRAGQSVLLIHHNRHVAASIRNKGVRIKELSGKVVQAHIETKSGLSRRDRPELILVTVKAYDTEEAAALIKKSVAPRVPVLSLQNGLGNVESLQHYYCGYDYGGCVDNWTRRGSSYRKWDDLGRRNKRYGF